MVPYLGSLVQWCCGEGGTWQTNITGMCGELAVSATLGLPRSRCVCFPSPHCSGSRLLCRTAQAGLGLRALPRLRFSGAPQRRRLGWACVLCPSQVQAAQATRCLMSTLSPGGAAHLITSPIPATRFPGCSTGAPSQVFCVSPWGADLWLPPSWRLSTVQDPRKTWSTTERLLTLW